MSQNSEENGDIKTFTVNIALWTDDNINSSIMFLQLHRLTYFSWHPQLFNAGFCCRKFCCLHATADGNQCVQITEEVLNFSMMLITPSPYSKRWEKNTDKDNVLSYRLECVRASESASERPRLTASCNVLRCRSMQCFGQHCSNWLMNWQQQLHTGITNTALHYFFNHS